MLVGLGFQSVWVSTDSEVIAEYARTGEAKVHWRAPYTATDEASSLCAVQEFIEHHPGLCAVLCAVCCAGVPILGCCTLRGCDK